MRRTFGALLFLMLCCSISQAGIKGVQQSWTYDPVTLDGTMNIVNQSHKEITAYSITIRITRNGSVEESEQTRDFLSQIVDTGTGGLAPGAAFAETISKVGSRGATNVQADVGVVVYADGTAEVTDDRAFQHLVMERKASILAKQKVNEVIQQTLADTSIVDHQSVIVAELKRLAAVYKNNHTDELTGFQASTLEMKSQEIPKGAANLNAFVKVIDGRISREQAHANLSKVVQP